MIILLISIVASVLWVAFNFINEWLLRRRSPPGSKLPTYATSEQFPRTRLNSFALTSTGTTCLSGRKSTDLCSGIATGYDDNRGVDFWDVLMIMLSITCFSVKHTQKIQECKVFSSFSAPCHAPTSLSEPQEEFRRAADKIGDANGKPLDLNKYVVPCAFNNIVSFFYGDLFTHDHPMRSKLHSLMNQAAAVLFVGSGHQYLPKKLRRLLAWIPFTQEYRIAQVMAKLDALSK
ncbi:hypothetical protein HPB52_016544 [Rhipicephalus sanguineus]|uniref:Cytochrome P450 n=1 Tax=Rhipicephalus sanguineus TaxID=34632 RepID=A0A9D4QCK8_RHISA|nr:hypothetical protein HPB52_016544 [Rhipicephalus sanguineus]